MAYFAFVTLCCRKLTITRTYDSRRRHEDLDFGKGWSIGYQDVRVQENKVPGYAWQFSVESGSFGVPNYCVRPSRDNIITIALPDGKVERFKAVAIPECSTASTAEVSLIYEPLDDTYSQLKAPGTSHLRVVNGHLVDALNGDVLVDPNLYYLTTAEGYVYEVDQEFGIKTITEPQGETLTFDHAGIIHSLGANVDFVRDGLGRITDIIAPDGSQTRYHYDSAGDLVMASDAMGNDTTFAYHAQFPHYLETITDPLGNRAIKNIYDENGRLVAQIDAEGNRIDMTHDIPGRKESIKDANGNSQSYIYDDRGNVLSETNALGETTLHGYDNYGNELTRTNPLGHATSWGFDSRGRQITETDPLGHTTTTGYDQYNAVTSMIEADGTLSLTNVYERVTKEGLPINGPLEEMTDALGHTTYLNYTGGQLTKLVDSLSNRTRFTYDYLGRKTSETLVAGFLTYPDDGGLPTVVTVDGKVTTYTYDENGRVLTETTTRIDENGVEQTLLTQYEYDANGNLTQTTDPLGNITQ